MRLSFGRGNDERGRGKDKRSENLVSCLSARNDGIIHY
jgi:hypothetical protein